MLFRLFSAREALPQTEAVAEHVLPDSLPRHPTHPTQTPVGDAGLSRADKRAIKNLLPILALPVGVPDLLELDGLPLLEGELGDGHASS